MCTQQYLAGASVSALRKGLLRAATWYLLRRRWALLRGTLYIVASMCCADDEAATLVLIHSMHEVVVRQKIDVT